MVREIRSTLSGGFRSVQCHLSSQSVTEKAVSAAVSEKKYVFKPIFFFFINAESTPGEIHLQIHTLALALYFKMSPRSKAWELML